MRKPKWFTLEELLTSSTARKYSIENLPSFDIVERLCELGFFLDGIREAWGSGVRVSSGFRNRALNAKVGGVPDSVHQIGYAADIQPVNGKFKEFKAFLVKYLQDKNFDEAILERNKKAEWVHIQLYSNKGFQRRKIFSMAV